jgi:hypothetical protein
MTRKKCFAFTWHLNQEDGNTTDIKNDFNVCEYNVIVLSYKTIVQNPNTVHKDL